MYTHTLTRKPILIHLYIRNKLCTGCIYPCYINIINYNSINNYRST